MIDPPGDGIPQKVTNDQETRVDDSQYPRKPLATAASHKQGPTDQRCEWLIYNAACGQFWGPNSGGYFGLWGAGLYTEADARRLAGNKDRMDRVQHITEYRDRIANMRGAFERLSAALHTTSSDGLTTGVDSAGSIAPRTVNAEARAPHASAASSADPLPSERDPPKGS